MTSEERKEKVEELRKYHESTFVALGIPDAYFCSKFPHVPIGMTSKHIGLYESECIKGDDVYIECCDMNYKPLDERRMLYVWKHDTDYKNYEIKKDQFLCPVAQLHVVDIPIGSYSNPWGETPKSKTLDPDNSRFLFIRDTNENYNTVTYKGVKDTEHEITYLNKIPHKYVRKSKTEGHSFVLSGESLLETIEFFKTINTIV